MKITAVKTVVVNAEMRNWVFVKVETDVAGLHGWGEASLEWKTRNVVGAVEDFAPMLVGEDPARVAMKTGNLTLFTEAFMTRILMDKEGRRVAGIEYTKPDGKVERIEAKALVLACSAVETYPEKNPTLTNIALSWRMSDRLAEKFKRGEI